MYSFVLRLHDVESPHAHCHVPLQEPYPTSSRLHSEIYECLSCSFTGVRERTDASSLHNGDDSHDESFMAHAILHNHSLGTWLKLRLKARQRITACTHCLLRTTGLFVRKQQLYCASCCDFVYPTALCQLHGSPPAPTSTAPPPPQQQEELVPSYRGLVNMGNTCYMNVVLQALAHNPLLQHHFLVAKRHSTVFCKQQRARTTDDDDDDASAECLGCDLCAFLAALASAPAHDAARPSPFVPHKLMETLWHVAPSFIGAKQHDAHEFFLALLNGVHAHTHTPRIARASDASPTSPRFTPTGTSQCDCAVHQHFAGALVSQVECSVCGEVSCTYDPFLDLSLSLDGASSSKRPAGTSESKPLSLTALLEAFTVEESLRGINRVYCRRCRTYANMTKHLRLHARPNVLVIHIKRLDFHKQQKRGTYVAFPLTDLRLDAYVADDESDDDDDDDNGPNSTGSKASRRSRHLSLAKLIARTGACRDDRDRYDLVAVVNHHGDSVQGGHYTAFIQSRLTTYESSSKQQAPPQWLLFDDASVSHVSANEVAKSQAYMLFYIKRRSTLLLS